jgi:acetylornithine/succinyldiaminopimelate/putrescine aminotransferase
MGATLMTSTVAKSMEENGNFYSTYGWHPRSTHVAIATMHYIIANRQRLLSNVNRMSERFRARLSRIEFKSGPKLNISGLAIGVDVEDEDYASEIQERCKENGLLLTTEGSTLLLLPPLNISSRVADEGLEALARSAGY